MTKLNLLHKIKIVTVKLFCPRIIATKMWKNLIIYVKKSSKCTKNKK